MWQEVGEDPSDQAGDERLYLTVEVTYTQEYQVLPAGLKGRQLHSGTQIQRLVWGCGLLRPRLLQQDGLEMGRHNCWGSYWRMLRMKPHCLVC